MNRVKNLFLLLFFCFFTISGFSQVKTQRRDSISIYEDIHNLSKKSKFNKFVYKLLFRASALNKDVPILSQKLQNRKDTVKSNGKIIRNITIETLDPFGYSIRNENKTPQKGIDRFGNAIHIKTK